MLNGEPATLKEMELEAAYFLTTYKDDDGLRFGDVLDYGLQSGIAIELRRPVFFEDTGSVQHERRLWLLRFIAAMRGWYMDYIAPNLVALVPVQKPAGE